MIWALVAVYAVGAVAVLSFLLDADDVRGAADTVALAVLVVLWPIIIPVIVACGLALNAYDRWWVRGRDEL